MGLATIESSFVQHTSQGIKGFDHPDFPALRIAQEVLNATESYLWVRDRTFMYLYKSEPTDSQRSIRGSGLAYGAFVSVDLEAGLTMFSLYRVCDIWFLLIALVT
jgi:Zn-dependent M16 (insulinase) family peptidase